jgi:hypothetical protein
MGIFSKWRDLLKFPDFTELSRLEGMAGQIIKKDKPY